MSSVQENILGGASAKFHICSLYWLLVTSPSHSWNQQRENLESIFEQLKEARLIFDDIDILDVQLNRNIKKYYREQ